jgi:ribosome maturation factor RimP
MANVDSIVQAVAPVVAALGLDLYDIEITGAGKARVVRVLVDKTGGIDLEGIAAATEAVSPVLDSPAVDAMLTGPYALEVSSPGLERPLRTPTHFARATGETISVKTRAGGQPARRVRGVVQDAGDTGFDLVLDDGTTEHVEYGDVAQARTVFEWGPQPKRPKTKSSKSTKTSSPNASPLKASPPREAVRP